MATSPNLDRRAVDAIERLGSGNKVLKLDALLAQDIPGGPAKALVVGVAGTIDFTDISGTAVTGFPVFEGLNIVPIKRLTAVSGASNIWALLDVRS